jgi:hypothetical protein
LGNPKVKVNSNGVPARLLGFHSNGEPFAAVKVKKNDQPGAEPFVRGDAANSSVHGDAKSRKASSPHVPGATGELGNPKVKVNSNGVPAHVLGVHSNGQPFVAPKVAKS